MKSGTRETGLEFILWACRLVVEAAGSFRHQPHGGRTSAMPTAEAGRDRRLGPLSRRVGC
jgi:hypothetical protein